MKRLVFSLLLLAMAAHGQDSPPYRIGGGVSAPRVISKKELGYSEEARKARLEGTVVVSLVVGEDGAPRDVKAARSLGFGLDEKAIQAVSAWRFAPGQKEGNPVAVQTTIEVNFRLPGRPGHWRFTRAAFDPPAGASVPSLVKQEFPPDSDSHEPGWVTLTLEIDQHGNPINFHVEKASDAEAERDVIEAAREWRFNPGMKNGTPIVVPLTLEFARAAKAGN